MQFLSAVILVAFVHTVKCLPLESVLNDAEYSAPQTHTGHSLWKRFVNPMFAFGEPMDNGLVKLRTRRNSEDECEKLALCKLHARSQVNFISAFQLYFVNKRNAQLWDHHARTIQDCENRFGDCYDK